MEVSLVWLSFSSTIIKLDVTEKQEHMPFKQKISRGVCVHYTNERYKNTAIMFFSNMLAFVLA